MPHLHKSDFRFVPVATTPGVLFKMILNSLIWTALIGAAVLWIGAR